MKSHMEEGIEMAKKKVNPSEDLPTASSVKEDEVEALSGDNEEEDVMNPLNIPYGKKSKSPSASESDPSPEAIAVTNPEEKDNVGSPAVKKRPIGNTSFEEVNTRQWTKLSKTSERNTADEMKKPFSFQSEDLDGDSLLNIQEEEEDELFDLLHETQSCTYTSNNMIPSLQPPKLKLRFINSPPSVILTGSKIVAEDGNPLTIELVDAATNMRVHTSNSFPGVEIVALSADITKESWTTKEFNQNILRPREGKRPLLVGDLTVTLKDGFGMISENVAFTDNSSWQRSKKFRLGAKVAQGGVSVSEAITNVFKCKDQLGESYKKQDPLYSGSEAKSGLTESRFAGGNRESLLGIRHEKFLHSYKSMKPARDSVLPPKLKLRFINSPPRVIFTDSKVVAEDGNPLTIELVDAKNTRVHTSNSFEIVPMNADITTEESWSSEEFNRNILRPREGKRPLLVGDLTVTLKDGFGMISGNVTFTDNSLWQRSQKFRLGAKVTQGGVSVSGAITNAFKCKAKRGESYQKQYPPPYSGSRPDSMARSGLTESSSTGGNISDQQNPKQQLQIRAPPPSSPTKVNRVFPRVKINTSLSDFKNLVHQLTGLHSSVSTISNRASLQEDRLNIDLNKSPYINVNDAPFSDVFAPISTCLTYSASKDYDVVIRCGRAVIRNNDFTSHLRAALSRRGISVHEDFDEVDDAVPRCRILIIFLTSTYVPSSLLNILQHQCNEPRVVYPFFYGISPSDLITNCKNYERFFLQYQPKEWQAALKQIAQMPGYILTAKPETELIDEMVRDALKVLCSNDKEKMIGMDKQVDEIVSLLCIESPDVRSIGIWGTVGVGKTAIAEEIFRIISVQYETCVFLKDFHEEVEAKGHDAVRDDFLSKVLEVEPNVIQISHIKPSFLRSRLQRKRVLIVLDDVNDFRDAEAFLGKFNYFGPGSRVIITSRNRHVFVQCKIDHVYEVKPLDISQSLLLLNRDTLQATMPHEVYKTLSLELVKFSSGNPQVLQFCSKSEVAWAQLTQQVQKASPVYIPDIFERSCCGLDDNERSIFLDIACFFIRMDKDDVAMLLDGCGFSAHIGFRNLVDKSLLTISHNMVDMLRFIQATGREIIRQESADRPGDRSRLWDTEDIQNVFTDNTGTSAIEGIFLDISKLKLDANPNVFDKMCNLRLLKFYFSKVKENNGVCLPQGLEYLPSKLRLLHWEYYPLRSLPQCFDPKNLVELNLPNSYVKKLWKGKKSLETLKKLRLSHSYHLTKIPRLSSAPNLELLDLEGCKSLVSISQSICYLKKLVSLNLKDCSILDSVPSMVDLESLEVLNLSGCSKLENFPEISPNVKELYVGGTMIQEIPSSIKNLVLLEKLDLENSRHLKNLPTSISKLKHLETLNLSDCSSLELFPDLNRKMKCLKSLDLSRTAIKELPSSISYLTTLEELRFVGCKSLVRLPDIAWSLRFKVEFRQIDTDKFSKLWNRFAWLKKVQIS